MRVLIVGIIVLAVSVAGVSTYLIKSFSGEENLGELEREAKPKVYKVLIVNKDLQVGAPVSAGDLEWQVWAQEVLNKEFIVVDREEQEQEKMMEFAGGVTKYTFKKGEPVLVSKLFKRENAGFMAGMLGSGMRAVSVPVSATTAASGFIMPGDYVDVALTHSLIKGAINKRQSSLPGRKAPLFILSNATEIILSNIRIIAIGAAVQSGEQKTSKGATATLELTPKQALIITTAGRMGSLSLILRSLERSENEVPDIFYATDVEASPFLSNIDKILEERLPKPKPTALKAPIKRKKPIKMYLGKAGSVNEVGAAK